MQKKRIITIGILSIFLLSLISKCGVSPAQKTQVSGKTVLEMQDLISFSVGSLGEGNINNIILKKTKNGFVWKTPPLKHGNKKFDSQEIQIIRQGSVLGLPQYKITYPNSQQFKKLVDFYTPPDYPYTFSFGDFSHFVLWLPDLNLATKNISSLSYFQLADKKTHQTYFECDKSSYNFYSILNSDFVDQQHLFKAQNVKINYPYVLGVLISNLEIEFDLKKAPLSDIILERFLTAQKQSLTLNLNSITIRSVLFPNNALKADMNLNITKNENTLFVLCSLSNIQMEKEAPHTLPKNITFSFSLKYLSPTATLMKTLKEKNVLQPLFSGLELKNLKSSDIFDFFDLNKIELDMEELFVELPKTSFSLSGKGVIAQNGVNFSGILNTLNLDNMVEKLPIIDQEKCAKTKAFIASNPSLSLTQKEVLLQETCAFPKLSFFQKLKKYSIADNISKTPDNQITESFLVDIKPEGLFLNNILVQKPIKKGNTAP